MLFIVLFKEIFRILNSTIFNFLNTSELARKNIKFWWRTRRKLKIIIIIYIFFYYQEIQNIEVFLKKILFLGKSLNMNICPFFSKNS